MRNPGGGGESRKGIIKSLPTFYRSVGSSAALVTSFALLGFSVFVLFYVFIVAPNSGVRSEKERHRQSFYERVDRYL